MCSRGWNSGLVRLKNITCFWGSVAAPGRVIAGSFCACRFIAGFVTDRFVAVRCFLKIANRGCLINCVLMLLGLSVRCILCALYVLVGSFSRGCPTRSAEAFKVDIDRARGLPFIIYRDIEGLNHYCLSISTKKELRLKLTRLSD